MARTPKKVRGVFERVKGSSVWWIRYTDQHHKKHREKVASHKQAVAVLAQRQKDVDLGRYDPDWVEGKRKKVLFSEVAKERNEYSQRLKGHANDSSRMEWWNKKFKGRPAESIYAKDVEKGLAELRKTKKPGTVNRYLTTLRAALEQAVRNKRVDENACKYVKRYNDDNHRNRYLGKDEEQRLYKVLPNEYWRLAVSIALNTGLRKSEQLSLLWKDVDFRSEIITVRETKAGKIQHIEMNPDVVKAFKELRSKPLDIGRRVFYTISRKGKSRYYVLTSSFEKYLEKAGIEGLVWHDLRHTFVSRLVKMGVNIPTVKELARHASIVTTMRYTHLYPDDRKKAVDLLCSYQENGTERTPERTLSGEQIFG